MVPEPGNHYGNWNREELRKAEATAARFLEDNAARISETLQTKLKHLEALVERVGRKRTTFDQRLDCFARITEIAQALKDDAEGFFELASQPVVAGILSGVKKSRQ